MSFNDPFDWLKEELPLRDPDGELTGSVMVATGPTDQVRARPHVEALQIELLTLREHQLWEQKMFRQQ